MTSRRSTRSCNSTYRLPPEITDACCEDGDHGRDNDTEIPSAEAERKPAGENIKCKICSKIAKIREHALCCDLCDRLHHQRCLGMAPARYEELRNTPGEWFCPECAEIRHVTTTSYRQDQHSSSGESDVELNTTFGSQVNDTPNSFNSNNFTMTPAQLVVTPAPTSSLDAANSSFQSVVPLDRSRRSWDTSLLNSQNSHRPLLPQSH